MMQAKNLTILVMLLATCLGSSLRMQGAALESARGQNGVMNWAAPAGEKIFEDYTLQVNSHAVPVYVCRVSAMPFDQVWPGYQRPLDQTELAGFAYWGMSGAVQVEVTARRPFQSVAIRPTSRAILPTVQGQRITFQFSRPGQLTVELDGPHHALHLFADPPEGAAPKAGDPNVLYFGLGVHRPGKIQLQNGQTIYVAGGAVVYAMIEGHAVSGVRILGRGIIDSSEFANGCGSVVYHVTPTRVVRLGGHLIGDAGVTGFRQRLHQPLAMSI